MLGPGGVSPQAVKAVHAELGLNHPLPVRFLIWLGHTLHGQPRVLLRQQHVSVRAELAQYLPVTLEIIVLAMIISLVLAIPGRGLDRLPGRSDGRPDLLGHHLRPPGHPSFVLALLLILVFAVKLHVFPASGWIPFTQNPAENLRYAFLPAFTLALPRWPSSLACCGAT